MWRNYLKKEVAIEVSILLLPIMVMFILLHLGAGFYSFPVSFLLILLAEKIIKNKKEKKEK